MTTTTLLLFIGTELLLSLSPGPAVLLVASQGVRSGFAGSVRGALGIMTGDALYFTLSALGLGALLLASEPLFVLIKWAGALYLIFLGTRLIIASFADGSVSISTPTPESPAKLYRQGLWMQLANPKAILFFTALLPQFIDPTRAAAPQFVVLGLVSMAVQFPTLLLYGWLAARGGGWLKGSRYGRWLDRLAGTFLVGAGVKLALAKR